MHYAITIMLLSMVLKQTQRHSIKIELRNFLVTLLRNVVLKEISQMVKAHCIHYDVLLVKQLIFCSQTTILLLKTYFTYKETCYKFLRNASCLKWLMIETKNMAA